jgi:hypothetical protein
MDIVLPLLRALVCIALCGAWLSGQTARFRHFVGGGDAGRLEVTFSENSVSTKNSLTIERRGSRAEQGLVQEIAKDEKGNIMAKWDFANTARPQRGLGRWSPAEPDVVRIAAPGGAESQLAIGADVLLWPLDVEERMRQSARGMAPIKVSSFSFASSSVSAFDLLPEASDPVGAFADAVRYSGTVSEGGSISYVTAWISPSAGQIRQVSSQGGLLIVTQREELAPPGESHSGGPFEWTVRKLPQQPFLAWRDEIRIQGLALGLMETAQQKRVGDGDYLLSRAYPPSGEDMRQPPARGDVGGGAGAAPEDAPYLEDSPLLGFNGPEIASLASRLPPSPNASRWEVSCLINSFVFSFIRDKALDVGFASAPEVALAPRGDCTEHTVLAIALLRRAGVPARAAWGWAGLDDGSETSLGLHTWAEVKIGGRWIPIDPTFDQAPAGAFRVALGNSALNSLAEFGRGLVFPAGAALKTIAAPFVVDGKRLIVDDAEITVSNGQWALFGDRLFLEHPRLGQISVSGNIRTLPRPDAKYIHIAGKSPARYTKSIAQLAIDCGKNRWLYFDGLSEAAAAALLGELLIGNGE